MFAVQYKCNMEYIWQSRMITKDFKIEGERNHEVEVGDLK